METERGSFWDYIFPIVLALIGGFALLFSGDDDTYSFFSIVLGDLSIDFTSKNIGLWLLFFSTFTFITIQYFKYKRQGNSHDFKLIKYEYFIVAVELIFIILILSNDITQNDSVFSGNISLTYVFLGFTVTILLSVILIFILDLAALRVAQIPKSDD